MRNRFNTAFVLAIFLVTITTTVVLAAAPPLPSSFYGTVLLGGQNVPEGTVASAWINGVKYAETKTFVTDGQSVYRLDVPGDIPDTTAIEGGHEGDTIHFQVLGYEVDQTATWHTGTYIQLNLTASVGAPIALDQSVTTDEDIPLAITLRAIDTDPLKYTIVTQPTFGQLTGTPPSLTYTPNTDYFGPDSFTFKANDGAFDSNVAAVSITVRPLNDAPRIEPIPDQTMDEGTQQTIFIVATDPESQPITLSVSGLPAFAQFIDNGGGRGSLSLAPGFNDAGSYPNLTIRASDGQLTGQDAFTLTVKDAASVPKARFSPAKGLNAAQWEDGATIAAYSSVFNSTASYRPENAIDNNPSSNWATANGQTTNQWIKVNLTGNALHVVDRVVLKGAATNNSLKDFEIRASTTGAADADFTTIFTGTVPQDSSVHEFTFSPIQASYVQLFVRDNWGSTANIVVSHFQVWTRDRDGGIVSLLEGPPATIAGFSSQPNATYGPGNAIDENAGTFWSSASGQTANQWFKVKLGGGLLYTIDHVRLQSTASNEAARDFEIRVSTTSADDAAFSTVFSGTMTKTTNLQEFVFASPVQARYVQLLIRNNYSSTCCIRVNTFQVLTPDGANVARDESVGAFVMAASTQATTSTGPEKAIDFSSSTYWQTASGQVTNQWFKVRLIEGAPYFIDRVRLEAPLGGNSPKDFEIRVSNATLADADFATIFTATLPSDGLSHWFIFPAVEARYVQLFIRNNYNGTAIQVKGFQVYSLDLGGATVPFDDFSSDPRGVPIRAWSWDFGDGTTSTEQHPMHTFSAPGVYSVHLTVTNQDGLSGTATMNYTVLQPPTVDFTWSPTEPNEGQNTTFRDLSTDDAGPVLAWRWHFAHTATEQTSQTGYTSFPDNGEHPVTLTVTDSQFLTASATKTVTALNAPPTASAGPDLTVIWGQNWTLYAAVSDPGLDDRTSLVCKWDFGDGQSAQVPDCDSTSARVPHAYASPGVYTATLTVTDKDGASDSDTLTATVIKRDSLVSLTAGLDPIGAGEVTVTAKLEDRFDPSTPMVDKLITFSLDKQVVSAMTDSTGVATAKLTFTTGVKNVVIVAFDGDAFYNGSVDKPFAIGDVFAGVGPGKINQYDPTGNLIQVLNTMAKDGWQTGMCFDTAGNLYATNFSTKLPMTKLNNRGRLPQHPWGGQFSYIPESCVADAADNIYVGGITGSHLDKFDAAGNLLATFKPAIEAKGIDWIDLAADQCTMFYTSEGSGVKRFNVCTNTQLPDFATGLTRPCYALRIRENSEVMVACAAQLYRLSATGVPLQTYKIPGVGENFFAMNLDPDNTSFWTGGFNSGNIYRIDIATGKVLTSFKAPTENGLAGLAVFGEITVASNQPPVADAGPDQTATAGILVTLDGSGSTDPNPGDTLTFAWTQVSGPTVTLSGADTITPTFTPTQAGTYTFELTVSDGRLSDTDTVTINVEGSTDTPTSTATQTLTDTPTETLTSTSTATQTPTDTPTPTPTATSTPTPTDTSTPTPTSTLTDTPSPTATYTYTPTPTLTATPTATDTPTPTITPSATPTATQTPTSTPIPACELYPIALHTSSLDGAKVGDTIEDIFNGMQPGNFGWLTWTGDTGVPSLVTSLNPPGDSNTYINPRDPDDRTVSIGDWVQGRPGVANAITVRNALDKLKTMDIIVPVWDEVEGNGDNMQYRISNFARVRLTEYELPGKNQIAVRFLGYAVCGRNNNQNIVQLQPFHDRVTHMPLRYEGQLQVFLKIEAVEK
ncbi:MAG TPA: PKD domain-containing protein [Anaerolineales bacterium]|nr:PKD domain-containing protein [Anaerolineales bacterium]